MPADLPSAAAASRRYEGLADLPALLDFASRATAAKLPLRACWHPGDIVWELKGAADQPHPARFWEDAEGVQALAWFVGPGELWTEATPGREDLIAEAVRSAEDRWRARAPDPAVATLKLRAQSADTARIATFEGLGYAKAGPEGVLFRRDLTQPLPPPEPPPGFSVRDCVGVDPALRAAAHRAAWNHLGHLGIESASQFSTELYLGLTRLPRYDPSLDMLVVAPSGAFAAGCIGWADSASGVGDFEPVGTALAWRGRRLAELAMTEAMRRMRQRGLKLARVGTAHFNASAIAAYGRAFEPAGSLSWWEKRLT
jgi:hypothetical protein